MQRPHFSIPIQAPHSPLPSTTVIHQRALLTISAATFLCSYMKQRGRGGRGTRSSISIHVPHTRFLWPDLASRVAHYCSGSSPLSPQRMKRERKGGGVARSTGVWQVHNGKQYTPLACLPAISHVAPFMSCYSEVPLLLSD